MRSKRLPALCCAAALCAVLLAGCADTRVVLTTSLASDELFRIGDVSCMLPEALVYLNNQKNQYENIYGIEMWEHDFGETTLEDYLKNQVVSQLAQVKSMVLLANEQEIALSEQETARAAEAAEDYYSSLSSTEVQLLEVDEELIQGMYEDYCLAQKAYDQITEDSAVEISDDEARIIQAQQIFVLEENLANELKEKLDEGADFESLASTYSRASQTTLSIARGDKEEAYEEIAFDLDNGEISPVFAADGGYYILKCLSTYLEEESEANKVTVAQQRKTERFQEIYSELMDDTLSDFQQKLWDSVNFEDYEEVTTDSFFAVYEEYFED